METVFRWILGLIFSLVLGQLGTRFFLERLRHYQGLKEKPENSTAVPPVLTGSLERLFFTILVGSDIQGAPIAMIAWLALKLAPNWNRLARGAEPDVRRWAFTGVLGGLVSMLFALLGGLICRP